MKFKIESNWLLRTEESIELNPEDFLYCATIEELNSEIHDKIHQEMKYPNMKEKYIVYEECLGTDYWDTTYGEFMLKWQRLKGLPLEL